MSPPTNGANPRVWIGCLCCYNNGDLIGEWVDAIDAADITPADIHGGRAIADEHEELWVMDKEHLPSEGEMSPQEATEWAEILLRVTDEERPALLAWVDGGYCVAAGGSKLPDLTAFHDSYAGTWPSFREFADQLVDDLGLINGAYPEAERYFNYNAWAHDLQYNYATAAHTDGSVHIFRIL